MATAVHSKAYRERNREARDASRFVTRDEFSVTVLELKQQIADLHAEVARHGVTAEPSLSVGPTQTLPESSETQSIPPLCPPYGGLPPKGANAPRKTPLESEKARLIRLDAWIPAEKERDIAYGEDHDDAWIDREADRYRCQQHNATVKHKDFDRGFRNWIRNAPQFEGKTNGNGHAKEPTARDKSFIATELAVRARAARRTADQPPDEPLLDRQRSFGYPPSPG